MANSSSIVDMTHSVIPYVAIGSLSLFSNVLLCIVFVCNRQMFQRAYNIIIFSLGIIDMLTGLLMLVFAVGRATNRSACTQNDKESSFLDAVVCGWMKFLFGKISIFFAMFLSLERWFAVVRPIQYRFRFKKRRVFIYIFFVIVTPLACKIHEVLYNSSQTIIFKGFVVAEVILTCVLPMLITWLTYFHIWYHCRISPSIQKTGSEVKKEKLLRMCATTAMFITVCWLPAEIYYLIHFVVTKRSTNLIIGNVVIGVAMGNSVVNPWIYYFTNQEYKKKFNSILKNLTERSKCVDSCCHLSTTRTIVGRMNKEKAENTVTTVRICQLPSVTKS